jgi:hypothetical protein
MLPGVVEAPSNASVPLVSYGVNQRTEYCLMVEKKMDSYVPGGKVSRHPGRSAVSELHVCAFDYVVYSR